MGKSLIHKWKKDRTLAGTLRIKRLYLRRGQGSDALRSGVLATGRSTGVSRPIGVQDVRDIAITKRIQGNSPGNRGVLDNSRVVIVKKEEELVPKHRPTDIAAELISDKWRSSNTRIIVKPVVGHGGCIAVILDQRTMKRIGTALGHQLKLSTTPGT